MGLLLEAMVAFCLVVVAFGSTSNPGTDEEQITSQLNAFHKYFHDPDPEALYDQVLGPRSCFMPPGETAVEGKANIVSMLRRFMERKKEVFLRIKRMEIFGDIAVLVLWYEEDGAQAKVLATGKALMIWKKDPVTKQWRLLYNIWN